MKIIKERFDHFSISYPLEKIASLEKILFIDIETTGFTARSSYLYMIGCAYYQEGNWHTIQWMAENYEQEADILTAFFQFAENFECLIHFNGNVFDLPYMTQKCVKLSLPYTFDRLTGIDLYRRISPYKAILNLPNCKQKTMEDFLGIDREDTYNGKELISFYQEYVNHPNEQTLYTLLLHNRDDLRGMLQLLSMLSYYDLFTESVRARKVQANS